MGSRGLSSPEVEQVYAVPGISPSSWATLSSCSELWMGCIAFHGVRAECERARELEEEMLRLARGTRDPEQLLVAHWNDGACSLITVESSPGPRACWKRPSGSTTRRTTETCTNTHTTGSDPGILVLGYDEPGSVAAWLSGPGLGEESTRGASAGAGAVRSLQPGNNRPLYYSGSSPVSRGVSSRPGGGRGPDGSLERARVPAIPLGGGGTVHRASALTLLGQLDEGIAGMRAVMDAMRTSGIQIGHHRSPLAVLAGALGQLRGRSRKASPQWPRHRPSWREPGSGICEAEIHRVKGDLLLAHPTPDPAQAEAAFRQGPRCCTQAERKVPTSFARRRASRVCCAIRDEGRNEDAHVLLQPIYDWFTEGFDTQDLKDAKALLDEL